VRADYGFKNQRTDVTDILKDLVGRGGVKWPSRGEQPNHGRRSGGWERQSLRIFARNRRNEDLLPTAGSPPWLVVHRDSAIHAAAADKVFENIGDVSALILETVVCAHDLPAFFWAPAPPVKRVAATAKMTKATTNTPLRFVNFIRDSLRAQALCIIYLTLAPAAGLEAQINAELS